MCAEDPYSEFDMTLTYVLIDNRSSGLTTVLQNRPFSVFCFGSLKEISHQRRHPEKLRLKIKRYLERPIRNKDSGRWQGISKDQNNRQRHNKDQYHKDNDKLQNEQRRG